MTIKVEDREGVRTITFSDPAAKNALSGADFSDLYDACSRTAGDASIRVVVVTGDGTDFGAGANLAGRSDSVVGSGSHPVTNMRLTHRAVRSLYELPQPVIAKVRGVAVGISANIALACDFVVADTTLRFSEIFAKRGLSLDGGGSWLLPRTVGTLQARRLALLADMVGAQEALELGLVTWVKEPGELDEFIEELIAQLVVSPPVALALTKQLLQRGGSSSFAEALDAEGVAQAVNFATDAPEAMRAFASKETPIFKGEFRV